jgi:prephenate dehydrogenase
MKIFIVGLGLMGASYAEALKNKGYKIFGYDKNTSVNEKAIRDGLIESHHFEHLSNADVVILALYPKDNVRFLIEHINLFTSNQILTDISGTKSLMVPAISNLLPDHISYISHHPMAGRAKVGYENRDSNMFIGNKCIMVTTPKSTPESEVILKKIIEDLGFKNIITTDAKTHDQMIAYTSQLTHVIAVSLMHMKRADIAKDATGDSFRDLTRIAQINENMWTELFLENDHELISSIDEMIDELTYIKALIESNNIVALKAYLRKAREKRQRYD